MKIFKLKHTQKFKAFTSVGAKIHYIKVVLGFYLIIKIIFIHM